MFDDPQEYCTHGVWNCAGAGKFDEELDLPPIRTLVTVEDDMYYYADRSGTEWWFCQACHLTMLVIEELPV